MPRLFEVPQGLSEILGGFGVAVLSGKGGGIDAVAFLKRSAGRGGGRVGGGGVVGMGSSAEGVPLLEG